MITQRLFLAICLCVCLSIVSGGILDTLPKYTSKLSDLVPSSLKDAYNYSFKDNKGNSREEKRVIKDPGTPNEKVVLSGKYVVVDEDGDFETLTTYNAGQDGYNSRFEIKNRKLGDKALKLLAG